MKPRPLLVLGMMSGTSADGIDAALVKISGAPPSLEIKLLNHFHQPFRPQIRKEILGAAEQNPLTPGQFSQLHARLGHVYAGAALAACKKFRASPERIDLIGNHGQTVFHQGNPTKFLGAKTASSFQLGDGSLIAALTGITTVSDFRSADMALGGQGAPLVPFADYALYRNPKLGRASLNIGGIANITVIPANAKPSEVFAFDTGPGNMLIDALVRHFTDGRQRYDQDARLAQGGRTDVRLLAELTGDPYFRLRPPKSTGREHFGRAHVEKVLALGRRYRLTPADMIRTVTSLTSASILDALLTFVLPRVTIHQLIVSGGGANNPLIMRHLGLLSTLPAVPLHSLPRHIQSATVARLPRLGRGRITTPIEVFSSALCNVPTDAKEALAFAILAYETFHRRPSNIPTATGARGAAILGKISYAPPR